MAPMARDQRPSGATGSIVRQWAHIPAEASRWSGILPIVSALLCPPRPPAAGRNCSRPNPLDNIPPGPNDSPGHCGITTGVRGYRSWLGRPSNPGGTRRRYRAAWPGGIAGCRLLAREAFWLAMVGAEWIYDGGSPGPWLCIDDDGRVLDAEQAIKGKYSLVQCELCGDTRATSGHADDAAAARTHWEAHVLPLQGEFDTFLLPPVGCTKAKSRMGWPGVFLHHKAIDRQPNPIPPWPAALSMAGVGWSDAGMGGGIEWPRGDLTSDDYVSIVVALTDAGHALVDAPPYVVDEDSYVFWSFSLRLNCSFEAVSAFFEGIKSGRLYGPVKMRQWVEGYDARNGDGGFA